MERRTGSLIIIVRNRCLVRKSCIHIQGNINKDENFKFNRTLNTRMVHPHPWTIFHETPNDAQTKDWRQCKRLERTFLYDAGVQKMIRSCWLKATSEPIPHTRQKP